MKAKISFENGEFILIELFQKDAPKTVENFKNLIDKGFYNGLKFHRVIDGFIAQGGCPKGTGTGGPGYMIKCEIEGNPRKHLRGSLSMAHAGTDTGGSQFFICLDAFPHLNDIHTVFGQVTEGMDVVARIKQNDVMSKVEIVE